MTQLLVEENASVASSNYIDGIPIRNIWLLMLYASDIRQLPVSRRVEVEENPDEIPELVAELLTYAVERRMRRNLTTGYRHRDIDLTRVRGRINLLRTERRQLLRRARVACSFDELTMDTPRNRYVRAALSQLAKVVGDTTLARKCRLLVTNMERAGIGREPVLTTRMYRPGSDVLGRLGAEDRQMLAAARLAFELALPTENPGSEYIASPQREGDRWIRQLFERAVGGFYEVVLSRLGWQVHRGRLNNFPVEQETRELKSFLPRMQTDIELEREGFPHNRIVIDTKFTSILKPGQYGGQRLDSGYIYQIYSYVRSQERATEPNTMNASGVLLHPAVGLDIDEAATIQGHEFRFLTVNLAADSQSIREQLLRVITPKLAKGQ